MPYSHIVSIELLKATAQNVEQYLNDLGFLGPNEHVLKIEEAGYGNMNVVVRAITNERSVILKQSLPYVRRFPDVAATQDRIFVENQFYQIIRTNETLKKFVPQIYFFDDDRRLICMEDFGPSNDFTSIYKKGEELSKADMADIARVVSELHFNFKDWSPETIITNTSLRRLNHHHIFEFPLQTSNGLNLDEVAEGLQGSAEKFKSDVRLKSLAADLGDVYLAAKGERLLHGDYYPGSWLKTDQGFRMIDPEFCYTGKPEFELGVAVAHLKMAQQPDSLIKDMFVYYHFDRQFDGSLFTKFTGMEVIRRILGLAQLPLDLTLKERVDLLDQAYEWVING